MSSAALTGAGAVTSVAIGQGGNGGTASGTGQIGGDGAEGTASARGVSMGAGAVTVTATVIGGFGGNGPAGGDGADATADHAVSGTTTGGTMTWNQSATAGAGGTGTT